MVGGQFLLGWWSVVFMVGAGDGRWSVVGVFHFYWSVVGFYFQKWSVVDVLKSVYGRRPVAHGRCSVVCGFVLQRDSPHHIVRGA